VTLAYQVTQARGSTATRDAQVKNIERAGPIAAGASADIRQTTSGAPRPEDRLRYSLARPMDRTPPTGE
jgi:hypothetical protein